MAKPPNDLKRRIENLRPLPPYKEEDPEDTQRIIVAAVDKAVKDHTVMNRILSTFLATVDKVPSKDRVIVLKWVIFALLLIILTGMGLKAFGKW
jgi:hypothetical protein